MHFKSSPFVLAVLCLQLVSLGAEPESRLRVTPDHASAVYDVGSTVHWSIDVDDDVNSVNYVLKSGGYREVAKGTVKIENGKGTLDSQVEKPGALLLKLTSKGKDGKDVSAVGGALAAIDRVSPSAPRPDDFDRFWEGKIEELQAVPVEPVVTPEESGVSDVSYSKITMSNIRSTHIRGQIARPVGETKCPAMLVVQWAGVYPLQKAWVTNRAKDGWLVLNINAHDLPIDESPEFYKQQSQGPLKDYGAIGNDDRETSYFLRMYLACYRAADYLARRPDWDGKTLMVIGGSQGGMQALVTAALHPKVTAATARVPAGCDLTGPEVGRADGWPQWYEHVEGKDAAKVHQASRYFDAMNFAPRIKCPVIVGVGAVDETCPPEGVIAMFDQISAPKELVVMPGANHNGTGDTHQPFYKRTEEWTTAIRDGKPAPVGQ